MVARLIGMGVLGLFMVVLILLGVYVFERSRQPKEIHELDVSVRPSLWWVDTRAIRDGTMTQVSITRVDNRTHEILERRILTNLRNDDIDYADQLDRAQDAAYEATRKANLGLTRR